MADGPNYSFYAHPRFSANHVAEYISADTANQREGVIRNAKFPRKPAVIPYSESKRIVRSFLGNNVGDVSQLDDDIQRLQTRLSREPDGWKQGELRRNIACIEEFKKAFTTTRAKRFSFGPGPVDLGMKLEGVRINTRLDLSVTEKGKDGTTHSGGCVMIIANTDASRRNLDQRQKLVAALVHWSLQEHNSNIDPLGRLCLSFDVFGASIVCAPAAIDRLRSNIKTSCREASSSWDSVEPPAGYDGPPWR